MEIITHSPAETESLGVAWAREVQRGWVIGLSGDLGVGKTQLVKGLARGLGITEKVHSPTFALVNEYRSGKMSLFHLDLYRLDTMEQIRGAGLEEYGNPDGITVIEWVDKWSDSRFFQKFRIVKMEALNETDRRITYEDIGL